ncbi:hypothetical protein [Cohaesibacter gelatinilyticus]|uniref:Uncharacterized protein n=1 Tax=Cohaesibacter gelatinilyticus TaxID=372072 RepID=A0A285PIZ0_9HYPH|nr:hypothetical protein [Cohaesibacter gelatinilyticus]SNZ21692.1 hypothetical protein SAMN06265368_4817 [Cohaesibacter gelatinilyticus]
MKRFLIDALIIGVCFAALAVYGWDDLGDYLSELGALPDTFCEERGYVLQSIGE